MNLLEHRRATACGLAVFAAATSMCGVVFALDSPSPAPRASSAKKNAKAKATLSIRAEHTRRTVLPGGSAAYRIRIRRGRRLILPRGHRWLAARIRLGARRPLPRGVTVSISPTVTRSGAATVTLTTTAATRPGTYRIRLRAGGRLRRSDRVHSAHTVVTLVVTPARQHGFTIHGTVAGLLAPGVSAPVDLTLTNPHGTTLRVSDLAVSVAGIQAPAAYAAHPCTPDDFAVEQFSGAYGFQLPPTSTRSLSDVGVPAGAWPRLVMLNRPANQDGCKHASLTLRFTGSASGGNP